MRIGERKPRRFRGLLVVFVLVAVAIAGWLALGVGPEPMVSLDSERPAVGRATEVSARFLEPEAGLTEIRLELIQGDRVELLDRASFDPSSLLPFGGDRGTPESVLRATVGLDVQPWLAAGEISVRATATRAAGLLRSPDAVVEEIRLPVRLTPPRLELISSQHYARQGGSGAVRYRVGPTAVRSGVRAGGHESRGAGLDGLAPDERVVLYAVPWDLADRAEVRLFAEDDAGNRVETPFLDLFRTRPPHVDEIRLSDAFLERVVPAIVSRTPGLESADSLLDQYLIINGRLRAEELDHVAALTQTSEPGLRFSEAFLQMPNSARMAGFAEQRRYLYDGREVDRQVHLGLDLASTARAPVPAPNTGRVVFAGWMSLYGNAVVIDHGHGLLSLSGHLSSVEVEAGDPVSRGDIVGRSGATGLAGGDHLHLEIFVHGQPVDPVEWLDGHWIADNITSKIGF
jgi:murein DD-endopeptidase MepM/ murein hydrolase activator NlpD